MWYVRVAVAEDWLRRSPYASTVLEQVRDGIRLKRGFGCGSAMSIKQVCCHCTHLSLSLAVAEDWLRRSPYASTVLEQVRDGIRLKRGFGGVSAEQIEQARLLCARLSLSLPAVLSRGGISVQGLRLIGNVLLEPKSVIRHAVSVSDWGNEAFVRLDVARYAFG